MLETFNIDNLINQFLNELTHKAPSTISSYKYALLEFAKYYKSKNNFDFDIEDLKLYRRYLEKRRYLAKYTVNTYLTALRSFLSFLHKLQLIPYNPSKLLNYKVSYNTKYNLVKCEDIITLTNSIKNEYSDMRYIIYIILSCELGLSDSEIFSLEKGEIKFDKKRFIIQKNDISYILNPIFNEHLKSFIDICSNEYLFHSISKKSRNQLLTTRGMNMIIESAVKQLNNSSNKKYKKIDIRNSAIKSYYSKSKDIANVATKFKIKNTDIISKIIQAN